MAKGRDEIEVKIPLAEPAAIRRRLRALGFRVDKPRRRECNFIWDAGGRLRREGKLLRLRRSGAAWTLTYKGPRRPGALKRRREIEIELEDGAACREMLLAIGFREQLRYDRFRTTLQAHGAGELDWDETPMGIYIELEGPSGWIRRTLRALGLRIEDAEQRSYPELYAAWRKRPR